MKIELMGGPHDGALRKIRDDQPPPDVPIHDLEDHSRLIGTYIFDPIQERYRWLPRGKQPPPRP